MVVPKLADTSPLEMEAKYRINHGIIKRTSNVPEKEHHMDTSSWQFYAYMPSPSARTSSDTNNHIQGNEVLVCILLQNLIRARLK